MMSSSRSVSAICLPFASYTRMSRARPRSSWTMTLKASGMPAAELRLAAQGLLRDEGVGAGRSRVHLVVHEVVQLHEVDDADGDRILEVLACAAVPDLGLGI